MTLYRRDDYDIGTRLPIPKDDEFELLRANRVIRLVPVETCEYHREAMCRCQDCDGFDCSDFAGIGGSDETG